MELSLIGLQNAGKSSLVNVLTTGSFHEDMIPTVSRNHMGLAINSPKRTLRIMCPQQQLACMFRMPAATIPVLAGACAANDAVIDHILECTCRRRRPSLMHNLAHLLYAPVGWIQHAQAH